MLRKFSRAGFACSRRTGVAILAACAGLAATGVNADTLAQPKDDSLERAAADYIRFRDDIVAIEALPFDSAEITRDAHRRLGAHAPDKIASGWVAYAALVAADTPEFAEALKQEMKKKGSRRKGILGGRDGLIANLSSDPQFVRNMDGAEQAIAAVLAMTAQDGARITALGEAFKAQAYAMQKTKWGKQPLRVSSTERISEATQFGKGRGTAPAPQFERLNEDGVVAPALASAKTGAWDPNWGEAAPTGHMSEANAEVIMARVLNLAARYSTETLNPKIVSVYAKNNKSQRCLEMSKLTLDQCIAATRTPYEEAFCLGEHALNDIAICTGWVGDSSSS